MEIGFIKSKSLELLLEHMPPREQFEYRTVKLVYLDKVKMKKI